MRRAFALFFLGVLAAAPSLAVEPGEMLKNPALEARAQAISKSLRCVVCQNETIDESEAPLAHDMRLLVRQRLAIGDSDDQARAYLVARYGDFVLLNPPLQANTLVLWFAPFALLASGGALFLARARRYITPTPPLSEEEQNALDGLDAPRERP